MKSELAETASSSEGASSKMQTAFKGAAGAGKAISVAGIGAATAIAGFSIEAASSAQVVDAKLSTAVKNAGGNMEDLEPKVDSLDGKMRSFGFTNDDTNTALATMTTALHSPAKAMADMQVAADLAKTKNISLAQAGLIVAKTAEGQTKALNQLGIQLPIVAASGTGLANAQTAVQKAQAKVNAILKATPDAVDSASKAHKSYESALSAVTNAQDKLKQMQDAGGQAMDALKSRVGGAANAYGQTFQGQLKAAGAQIDNIGEKIGQKLVPILTKMLTAAERMFTFLSTHHAALVAFGVVVGTVLVTALGLYTYATLAAVVAQTALTWPILAIIAGFLALIAVIALVIANWGKITGFMKSAWNAVAGALMDGLRQIASFWNKTWSNIASFFKTVGHDLEAAAKATLDWIVQAFMNWTLPGLFIKGITYLVTHWQEIWQQIEQFFKGALDWVVNTFQSWDLPALFQKGIQTILGYWQTLWTDIKNVFSGAKDWLVQVGENIVNGLVQGIENMASKAVSMVENLGKKITSSIKNILGIHSPSKVFADIGQFLVQGFTGGIKTNLHLVDSAATAMTTAAVAPVTQGVSAVPNSAGMAAAAAQPAAQGQKVISINMTNHTNASPSQIASKVGWTLQTMGGI